jgi:hypothetical protein
MAHDPLSPREALRTRTGAALAVVGLLVFVYSIVVLAQLLLGVIVGVGLTLGVYLTYRILAVFDSIADAAQRLMAVREREADHDTTADRDSPRDPSGDRLGERRE